MNIKFFGTTACIFDKNEDNPCFLVNGKYLFDTGFALVNNLLNNDINPVDIKYLFFTHMHHDHYISLPAFLFYYLQTGSKLEELTIAGPSDDVSRIVDKAMDFIEGKKFWQTEGPKVVELNCGDSFETEDMIFEQLMNHDDMIYLFEDYELLSIGKDNKNGYSTISVSICKEN